MATISARTTRKGVKHWRARIRQFGCRDQSRTFTTRKQARAWITQIEEALYSGLVFYEAARRIAAGDFVVIKGPRDGYSVGVAFEDIAAGAIGCVAIHGVHMMTKKKGAIIALGESVTLDCNNKVIGDQWGCLPGRGIIHFGIAAASAGKGVEELPVKLVPGMGFAYGYY